MALNKRALCTLISLLLGGFFLFGVYSVSAQENGEKKAELERQLGQLEKEASAFDAIIQQIQGEARTLVNETEAVNAGIKRKELEIKRIALAIQKAGLEINSKSSGIDKLSSKIDKSRKALAASIFFVYIYDQDNILTVLLKNKNLSDFFSSFNGILRVQSDLQDSLNEFREDQAILADEKEKLEDFRGEQQGLKALQEVERRLLAQKKKEKDELIKLTKGKEAIFQELLKSKKRDIATLKTQLFYIEKTGVTAEDAVRLATLAANRTGIRPAFLLALLEVETGKQFEEGVISVGSNVGTGNWRDDMYLCYQRLGRYYGGANVAKYNTRAEREKAAFFKITESLNLDPEKMPVSREPHYIGCGGAMGPAQFIPTTWLLYADKVSKLTGHDPANPWNVEDAFTAAATFLADSGAGSKTQAGEIRAAKTYLSGKPSCGTYVCRLYSSRIISLARDIDRIL